MNGSLAASSQGGSLEYWGDEEAPWQGLQPACRGLPGAAGLTQACLMPHLPSITSTPLPCPALGDQPAPSCLPPSQRLPSRFGQAGSAEILLLF
jgi:hypothetical protein